MYSTQETAAGCDHHFDFEDDDVEEGGSGFVLARQVLGEEDRVRSTWHTQISLSTQKLCLQ